MGQVVGTGHVHSLIIGGVRRYQFYRLKDDIINTKKTKRNEKAPQFSLHNSDLIMLSLYLTLRFLL
jgi:hypothetical protein